jgi:hypothetical protein
MADFLFKGPSEEEIQQKLLSEPALLSEWKACTIVVVGISNEKNEQGLHPILYSLAVYSRDFSKLPREQQLGLNKSQFLGQTWVKRDEEGHIIRENGQAVRLDPKNPEEKEEYIRRIREVPYEGFGEEYDPKHTLGVENPFSIEETEKEEESKAVNRRYPWLRKGKATIYRQQTGKFFNPESDHDQKVVVAEMTRTIRNILWTISLTPKAGDPHRPRAQITGEEIHSAIFERLKIAKQKSCQIKVSFVDDGKDLESDFLTFKVAVADPKGIPQLFESVKEALDTVSNYYQAEISQEEPMLAAASLKKDEAFILLRAAEILDSRAPLLAGLIDKTFFTKGIEDKAVVASLIRVADKFDEVGKSQEALFADQLLKQIVGRESSTK